MKRKSGFRPGDRVEADMFGTGTVVGEFKELGMPDVLWDVAPPWEYNLGTNPCIVHVGWLRKVASKALERPVDGRGE